MIYDSLDSSFESFEAHSVDPLSEVARIRVREALDSGERGSFEQTVESILCKSFDADPSRWKETTQQVMRGVVECLKNEQDVDSKIRLASETAVLTVAKRWGNVVSAGKASVIASREAAGKHGLNSVSAAQNAGLGAIEGVMRVGPVAYPVLRRELGPIVEGFEAFVNEQPDARHSSSREQTGPDLGSAVQPALQLQPAPAEASDSQELPVVTAPLVSPMVPEPEPTPELPPGLAGALDAAQPLPTLTAPAPVERAGFLQKIARFFGRLFGPKTRKA